MKAALDRDGERRTVERIGLSRIACTKIAAGLPVRRGTAVLAAIRLGLPVDDGGRHAA